MSPPIDARLLMKMYQQMVELMSEPTAEYFKK